MRKFITSDLHFDKLKLGKELLFSNINESNNYIIEQWNSVVNENDEVIILGDIAYRELFDNNSPNIIKTLENILSLNGNITVIGGNHDNKEIVWLLQEYGITVLGCMELDDFILTHIPIHPNEIGYYKANIHGHVHIGPEYKNYGPMYYNVSSELHDFKPILWQDIIDKFKK